MSASFTSIVAKQILTTLQGSLRCQTRQLSTVSATCRQKRLKCQPCPVYNPRYLHTSIANWNQKQSDKNFSTAVDVQNVVEDGLQVDSSLVQLVNEKIKSPDLGRLFAIVQVRGKQRKVTAEDIVVVLGDFAPTVGDRIRLEKVLMVGGKDFTLTGRPVLSRKVVSVEATVVEKTLSHYRVKFNYFRRKNKQKFKLFRDPQTVLLINNIELNQIE